MTQDEFVIKNRGFENFESDAAMVEWCEKVGAFSHAGWRRDFLNFYISDYCLDNIYSYLTKEEVKRLREYQKVKRAEHKAQEEARGWHKVQTIYYADNSTEEIWEDKNGIQKTVMVVAPHGDACY